MMFTPLDSTMYINKNYSCSNESCLHWTNLYGSIGWGSVVGIPRHDQLLSAHSGQHAYQLVAVICEGPEMF